MNYTFKLLYFWGSLHYDVNKNKGSANSTNITGEGVLIKLTGAAAQNFIKKHFEIGGKAFQLTDIDKKEAVAIKWTNKALVKVRFI